MHILIHISTLYELKKYEAYECYKSLIHLVSRLMSNITYTVQRLYKASPAWDMCFLAYYGKIANGVKNVSGPCQNISPRNTFFTVIVCITQLKTVHIQV